MERATIDLFERSSLRDEHFHRYILAAMLAEGRVVDCACGIGYGSTLLDQEKAVTSYLGMDPSEEAIRYATENYARPGFTFTVGTLEDNSCEKASVDTFVTLETLEHTHDPERCIRNISHILKADGLLIGSVPSADYDELCERVYGPNPFHLHRFTHKGLEDLLGRYFESARMFSAEFAMGTLFRPLDQKTSDSSAGQIILRDSHLNKIAGSLFFIAGVKARVGSALNKLGLMQKFLQSIPKIVLDQEEVEPVRLSFQRAENMIRQRDEAMAAQAKLLEERWAVMQSMEEQIHQRDQAIAAQAQILEARWAVMQSMEEQIRRRDETVALQVRGIKGLKNVLNAVSEKIGPEILLKILQNKQHSSTPFLDMAFSLYLFIARLYQAALKAGAQDLFFFSREGQPLKEMFDLYLSYRDSAVTIRSHYLQVSRRSTFLISLGPLSQEKFHVLFRQYRRIALIDFLKSLALEEHTLSLAQALGVDVRAFETVKEDLPNDPLFQNLLKLKVFQQLYEEERVARSTAFERYLAGLAGGSIPELLHVVDVGWKGSIQDNLFNWLSHLHGEKARIEGYYLGLVASGGLTTRNAKTGLLFSNISQLTPGFAIFNENRSLFEIILHADHGSAQRYGLDANGNAQIVQDEFKEKKMIEEKVWPVSQPIFDYFGQLAAALANIPLATNDLLKFTLKRHARMVFHPSQEEIDWIFSVYHVENFGVFEESRFGNANSRVSRLSQMRFTWHLLRRRRPSELGSWPWLTIKIRALPGLDRLYSWFRRWQRR